MKQTITTELIRGLRRTPPSAAIDIWDTKQPRLVLRARPNGKHSYRLALGRGKWFTIGGIDLFASPALARKTAQKRLGEHADGKDLRAEKRAARQHTLKAYITDVYQPWLTAHRKSGAKTITQLEALFVPSLGHLKLDELTPFHVERWRSSRLKDVTPATTNRDIGALRAMLSRAVDWGHVSKHPMARVKALPEDKIGRLRYLTPQEEKSLRGALEARDDKRRAAREAANAWRREREYDEWPEHAKYTDRLTPLVLVALHTGLRFGELTGLRWRDADLVGSLLTVVTANAKSGRARHVPLNSEARQVLLDWRPESFSAEAFVFPGIDDERLVDIKTSWQPLLKAAKVDGFRFHDLRHTFASKLVMAGVDLNTVRELLGHADIKMTLRYSHLAPEHKAAAVAKLVAR